MRGVLWLVILLLLCSVAGAQGRTMVSLNGTWQIADSQTEKMPQQWTHTTPVPGLAHSAVPAFADVDQFQSRELLSNLVRKGLYERAAYDRLGDAKGIAHQGGRNYFWYRRTFMGPRRRDVAMLKISKAQFGAAVYLNGVLVGEHAPCFTAAWIDVTRAVHWGSANNLVIRIGAHPNVLPANVSAGTDFEKNRWTPGIYDGVSLLAADGPFITNVQAAPHLASGSVLVQTELHNSLSHAVRVTVQQQAVERASGVVASAVLKTRVEIAAGATVVVKQMLPIRNAHLWSPADPFLYSVKTSTGGDSSDTRFGMREFRFDTATRKAYLNGKPFYLRGSNITLHRFFEDPEVGTRPWDEAWLKRLLVDIPSEMHWNAFRFCIGPVPDRWLEIADEHGLLIQNEYPVWVGRNWGGYQPRYDLDELQGEYREWMRDNWNHPSVVIWDASNESWLPGLSERVIPAVRTLDLSNRPWEDSYNPPSGPDDPAEEHPYLFQKVADLPAGKPLPPGTFQLTDLEHMTGPPPGKDAARAAHAAILNEYGWLWLNRDSSPTLLTQNLYPRLLPPGNTAEDRFKLDAYLLAGETEFWRSYRQYAGVLHFVYLTASDPNGFTSDHFLDVKTLQLEPHFKAYMQQAFSPVGVYLKFFQPELQAGSTREYTVRMVNDEDQSRTGTLRLVFHDASGRELAAVEQPYQLPALGERGIAFDLKAPDISGSVSLDAIAVPTESGAKQITSHRELVLQAAR